MADVQKRYKTRQEAQQDKGRDWVKIVADPVHGGYIAFNSLRGFKVWKDAQTKSRRK
jgi:hypothetical protein